MIQRYCDKPLNELTCEDHHQRALMDWTRLPEIQFTYPMLYWLYAIPNGGARDLKTASALKLAGVKPGVFDLHLPYPAGGYHGLYIEMKYGSNALSLAQQGFKTDMSRLGYRCVVCYSWYLARDAIVDYIKLNSV